MKLQSALLVALLACVPVAGMAADAAVATAQAPGKVGAAGRVSAKAKVEAVDAATRTVTFKGEKGNVFEVVAGDEVKNFDQIKVGDVLTVTYAEAIAFELKKGGKGVRERREATDAVAAAPGEKPAAAAGRRMIIVADVTKVDHKKGTVTLRGPKQSRTLKVDDPAKLKNVKVGDQVEVTYVEAVALEIGAK